MKTFKLLLLTTLIASCSSNALGYKKRYIIEQRQVGVFCPVNYFYSFDTLKCHKMLKSKAPTRDIQGTLKKQAKRPIRPLKNDCNKVFEQVNKCMGGR